MFLHSQIVRFGLLVSLGATAGLAQSSSHPVNWERLPDPFHTRSVRNGPRVIPHPDGAILRVPDGFIVEEYADEFVRPRFMLLGPSGEVLVSDSGGRDRPTGIVYVLAKGAKTPLIENLDRPYGLELDGNWLYVAETTSVKRYRYDAGAMSVGAGEEILSLREFRRGHWTRTVTLNRDRSKLFVTVGSGSNIDRGEPPMRAAVSRVNPDGTELEIFATGLRNPVGLRFHPDTDDLWVSVQERDGLGDDLVPDYLAQIRQGEFYGWPIAYIGPNSEPRHEDVDMAQVKSTQYPDVLLGSHAGVLDILFYTGTQFPAKYRGGMFAARHGSWNRAERFGYDVVFIPFEDGRPVAGPEDFLAGWMLAPDRREVWGRPVGLLQLPDGSLLVSDDGGRKIWRVSYAGADASTAPR